MLENCSILAGDTGAPAEITRFRDGSSMAFAFP